MGRYETSAGGMPNAAACTMQCLILVYATCTTAPPNAAHAGHANYAAALLMPLSPFRLHTPASPVTLHSPLKP